MVGGGLVAVLLAGQLLWRPGLGPGSPVPDVWSELVGPLIGIAITSEDCFGCSIPTDVIRAVLADGSVRGPVPVVVPGPKDVAVAVFFARERVDVSVTFLNNWSFAREFPGIEPPAMLLLRGDTVVGIWNLVVRPSWSLGEEIRALLRTGEGS